MSSFKRFSLAAMLAVMLLSAIVLTSCVSFSGSKIDEIPPLDFSKDLDDDAD